MFNYRIVVANKDLFNSIFKSVGKDYNNYKEIVNKYSSVFKPIAAWMLARDSNEFAINDIVSHLTEYINIKKLNPANIKVSKSFVVINEKSNSDLEEFINFVHGDFPIVKKQEVQEPVDNTMEHTPVLTGDGIKIFKVDKALDSKQLAADTSWCIAYKGPNNMWQSYRSNQAATFFIVWDENPPTPNVRKVALQYNSKDVKITDTVNKTGPKLTQDISFEYEGRTITGRDIPTYLTYLKSKGVNIDATTVNPETGKEEKILKNKPISPEEKLETGLGNYVQRFKNINVDDIKSWSTGKFVLRSTTSTGFIKDNENNTYSPSNGSYLDKPIEIPEEMIAEKNHLGKSAGMLPSEDMSHLLESITIKSESVKTYLSKFIGMGWIMPDEIVDHLMEVPGGKDYLVQYVNTGLTLPKNQTDKISKNRQLLNSYLKQQLAGVDQGANHDFAFLEYIDTNNEEVKKKILDRSLKSQNFKNFPPNWAVALPQLGLKNTNNDTEIDFNDEFVNKLAIIKGIKSVYKKYPTLENTRLLLQIPEAIAPLLEKAKNEKYDVNMFYHVDELSKWSDLWQLIPDKFKDDPEFIVYKAVDKANYLDYSDYQNLPPSQPGNILDNLTRIIYLMDDKYTDVNANDKNNIEFWKTSIEYFDKLVGSVFKKIHLLHPIGDEDDDNYDEDEIEEDWDKQYQQLSTFFGYLPKEVSSSDEFVNTVKSHASKDMMTFLLDRTNVNEYEKYFKNIREYLDSGQAWRSIVILKPNTFIVNLISNNNDENLLFELLKKLSSSFWDLSNFETLVSWYPEVLNKLSDQTFIKILQSSQQNLSPNMISIFANQKPHLFKEYIPLMNTSPQFKQQNPELFQNISREKLKEYRQFQLDRQEQYNRPYQPQAQNQQNLIEDDEKDDEEVLASVKSMLKIAQKLDFKKEYRLADKLTYILKKKI